MSMSSLPSGRVRVRAISSSAIPSSRATSACAVRVSVPFAYRSSASSAISAPRSASRSCSSPYVSVGPIGVRSCSSTSPVSIPASIAMIVTPVSVRPSRIADCSGVAPRYSGSKLGMHVERDRHGVEQRLRHDLPVRRDDERIAAERARVVDERLELLRREHAQPARFRRALHRRRDELLPAPRGPIGLRDDADDVVPCGDRFEDRDGELARPEDDELQRVPAATASASATSSSVSAGRMFLALSM